MRICIFTENYYKGGLDTFLINLVNAWPDSNDRFTVVCNSTHPGLETISSRTNEQVSIQRYNRFFTSSLFLGQSNKKLANSYPVKLLFRILYRVFEYPILFPWYSLSLGWYFYRSDYERLMVVNGGYPASLLCRCAAIGWKLSGKRPLAIFNFHNSAIAPAWFVSYLEKIIDKLVIKSSSKIITVSRNCMDSLKTRDAFKESQKLEYIYNGIDEPKSTLSVNEAASSFADSGKVYCLMLATYEARKGHFFLLDAFKQILDEFPYVRLLIYGFGLAEEKRLVMDRVKQLSLEDNVVLNDFNPQTSDLISNASVLVVPSQSQESFGLTIIEAMALGTPVVTTNVGGMPEVLSGSNCGYVCSKDDPQEFANAIKNILRDPSLANAMSANGRAMFEERFTARKMASRYETFIKQSDNLSEPK